MMPKNELIVGIGHPSSGFYAPTGAEWVAIAITSVSTRAPLRLAFPASLANRWMPGLFPEKRA